MRRRVGLLERIARARLGGQVIRRLRRAGFTDARYDTRGFRVRFTADGDETPTILELAPLLAMRGRRRRGQVDRFVAGLVRAPGLPRDWAEVRPLLRPVLRGGTPGSPLRRPVLPFLYEYVVVDQPETMTYVGPDQPAGWGVSAEQVFAAARANLSGAVLQGVASEPVVVRFVDDGDAYWTSHLLLEHWLERLAGQVGGVPVAFAPERGTLLVTADGSEHLRGLFAQAEEIYAASARPITPMAYGYDERGCTVPYTVAPDHPLYQTVRRAERVLAVHEYSRQAAQPPDGPPLQPAAPDATPGAQLGAARRVPGTRRPETGTAETGTAEAGAATPGPGAGAAEHGAGAAGGQPNPAELRAGNARHGVAAAGRQPNPAELGAGNAGHGPGATGGQPNPAELEAGNTGHGVGNTGHGVATAGGQPNPAELRAGNAGDGVGAATPETGAAGLWTGAAMAELRLVGSADEGWRTRAIWDRDEAALLPAADEVQVGEDVRPWSDVLPYLTVAAGHEPVRWAAAGWPQT